MTVQTPLEADRIRELHALQILDSAPAPEFDALVEHIRDLFEVPISLVSLVDTHRQWFKAKCGLEISGTSRDVAFCNHALSSEAVFVVEDASRDPRFCDNPLVVGAPHVRFYAGAPLVLRSGIVLGTLCVMGTAPRVLTAAEATALTRLAKVVMGLIKGHNLAHEAKRLVHEAQARSFTLERQARELEFRARRFQQAETMATICSWEVDLRSADIRWSDETNRICEFPPGMDVNLRQALSVYPPADRERLKTLVQRSLREGTRFDDTCEIVTAAGNRKWVRAVGDVEMWEGTPRRLFGILQDVTERRTVEARMWEAANRDALTGLANRHCFDRELDDAFAGPDAPGLLMVDADHLKDVNDTRGHEAGDLLIQTIATRLRSTVGERGKVARIGGDEFAVIVPAPVHEAGLSALAAELLQSFAEPIAAKGGFIKPQACIGGALGSKRAGPEALCQEADLGLYHAKETRRGGYVFFREQLRSAITARTAAISIVDEALTNGSVVAWYQPIFEVATGRISGLEALARVKRGDETLSIGEFASALQDQRIATRLTACILERIEHDVLRWKTRAAVVPRIALNVGSPDFLEGSLASLILSTCERSGIAPDQFALEVTENVFLSRDAGIVAETAAFLRQKGIIVALDDFGTGYASLAHLSTFPVDVIKMDRSFVTRLTEEGPGSIITSALIELAHRLNLQVVAEGVETQAQMDRLIALGCEKLQGYLLSKPLSPEDAGALLLRRPHFAFKGVQDHAPAAAGSRRVLGRRGRSSG